MTAVGIYYRPSAYNGLRSIGSLGASFRSNSSDPGIEDLQTELARLGFLVNERSPQGIDARWGDRTELALRFAAKYVGLTRYYESPIRAVGSTVEIPDELIAAIRSAVPATFGVPGFVGPGADDGGEEIVQGFGMGTLALVAAGALFVGFLVFRDQKSNG